MEIKQIGRTLSSYYFKFFMYENKNVLQNNKISFTQIRAFAARKGYREMARKKKVKTVIQKQAWVPHNLRNKDGEENIVKVSLEHTKPQATDDVWAAKFYAWRIFDFKEAVECHRETHHPTIYNVPDAPVNLFIELDMSTEKPTKFVDKFRKMATLPNIFEQEGLVERTVMAFCKTPEQQEDAKNAGANLVGGVEVIKQIEKGKIVLPDFRFIIAHPSILPEMVTIRGLLKRKFPNIKTGTLGPNMGELVAQFKNGVEYSCVKSDQLPNYGWINVCIGRLNMEPSKLEENFSALLNDINLEKPKRPGPFITRVLMSSPPSAEKLKIDLTPYLDEKEDDEASSDEEEDVSVKI